MGGSTKIAWTDHTFNPWLGCTRVSEGCRHCYAEALVTNRMGLERWGTSPRVRTKQPWKDVLKWNAASQERIDADLAFGRAIRPRARVFCASLADVFEDAPGLDAIRADLWPLIEQCTALDWQLLTKRPENIRRMVPAAWLEEPRPHVWFGTSCENQATAERRIPELLRVPAAVRFLSCEPLLGPIDLTYVGEVDGRPMSCLVNHPCVDDEPGGVGIDWVIVGGESGPGRRTMDIAWARALLEQCRRAGVPFFFKQGNGHRPGMHDDALGERVQEFPR